MTTKTPQRPSNNNNYAAPNTPIASAKRPRSSIDGKNIAKTPSRSQSNGNGNEEYRGGALSPMHPPQPPRPIIEEEGEDEEQSSWVNRKMDALFSPVLSFLATSSKGDEEKSDIGGTENNQDEQTENNLNLNRFDTSTNTNGETKADTPPVTDEDVQMVTEPSSLEDEELPDDDEEEIDDDDEEVEEHEEPQHQEEEEDEFNPYVFIKSLPHYEDVKHFRPPVALPKKSAQSPPITLVLDLDETLVHCTVEPTNESDLTFPVIFHGMEYQVHVKLRPYLFDFLEKIHDKFEVVVFTASQRVYADELLDRIDPDKKFIKHRMFRESCLPVEGNFLKDLTVCGRALEKTVLVDNSPHAFGYQMDNGIPIESWFDDPTDNELLKLEVFLRSLHEVDDVRVPVRKQFKTYQKVADAGQHHHHHTG